MNHKALVGLTFGFLFFSGAAGLIYQIIWTRMLLLVFGVTTISVVVVVVAFMTGLAAGSWYLGKISRRFSNPFVFYALLEIGIGTFAFLSPLLINTIMDLYKIFYSQVSSLELLLILKFVLAAAVIFLPTFFMGGTVPAIVRIFQEKIGGIFTQNFGRIYAVNTLGAVVGVISAAYIFIEVLGLSSTVYLAVIINFLIAVLALHLATKKLTVNRIKTVTAKSLIKPLNSPGKILLIFLVLFFSGFLAMASEIIWTRLLTPFTGTYVYAFAFILVLYLLGIVIGSYLYQRFFFQSEKILFTYGFFQILIGLCILLSILIISTFYPTSVLLMSALVILPATISMGIGFPVAASLANKLKDSEAMIGKIYSVNTLGSIFGPIAAGFVLLPIISSGKSLLVISAISIFLGMILVASEKRTNFKTPVFLVGVVGLMFILTISYLKPNYFYSKTLKEYLGKFKLEKYNYAYLEDNAASVLAFKNQKKDDLGLLVDGVGITILVEDTKLMAHLPMLLHPDPVDTLVICFGMGTTYRSAVSYGGRVDTVELVPSVVKTFPIFFDDAANVNKINPGKIYVGDGRNYVYLTNKKYDIITVDPPPPVNSSGTTVLYSRDFYRQSKKILKDGGIFMEWVTTAREDDFRMFVKSFIDEFPYVLAFVSTRDSGLFLIGSEKEVVINPQLITQKLGNSSVFKDLNEWRPFSTKDILDLYFTNRQGLVQLTANTPAITDDRPRTEYFLLRHSSSYSPQQEIKALEIYRDKNMVPISEPIN